MNHTFFYNLQPLAYTIHEAITIYNHQNNHKKIFTEQTGKQKLKSNYPKLKLADQ